MTPTHSTKSETARRIALTGLLLLGTAFGAGAENAPQARLQVTNASNQMIDMLQVSASSTDQWGDDLLGRLQLAPGASVFVNFPAGAECSQDVRVEYHDHKAEARIRVNACGGPALTFDGSAARPVTASR